MNKNRTFTDGIATCSIEVSQNKSRRTCHGQSRRQNEEKSKSNRNRRNRNHRDSEIAGTAIDWEHGEISEDKVKSEKKQSEIDEGITVVKESVSVSQTLAQQSVI
ncbi:hypothetical protein QL285_054074 [Trifolium repens]|nr:hypothetical protein QL285_054074 [Trifolium repens]